MQKATITDHTAASRAPPAKGGIQEKHANPSAGSSNILFLARKQNGGCTFAFLCSHEGADLWYQLLAVTSSGIPLEGGFGSSHRIHAEPVLNLSGLRFGWKGFFIILKLRLAGSFRNVLPSDVVAPLGPRSADDAWALLLLPCHFSELWGSSGRAILRPSPRAHPSQSPVKGT